ncbi:TetR/AcrR family transcriptional regulator [soil metagenome]
MAARAYTSPLRQTQAADTRARVLRAAAEAFVENGYTGTTLAEIARLAGVSVETVKGTAPKHQLLLSAFEIALAGREGQKGISEEEYEALPSGDELLEILIGAVAVANAASSGLWSAFLAAAETDERVRETLDALQARRRADYVRLIAVLDHRQMITTDAPREFLADALSFLFSQEAHQQLVTQSGWTDEHYREWLATAVRRLILT